MYPHPELWVVDPVPHEGHAGQVGGRGQHLWPADRGLRHQVAPEWSKQSITTSAKFNVRVFTQIGGELPKLGNAMLQHNIVFHFCEDP